MYHHGLCVLSIITASERSLCLPECFISRYWNGIAMFPRRALYTRSARQRGIRNHPSFSSSDKQQHGHPEIFFNQEFHGKMFALVLQTTASAGFLRVPVLGSDSKYVGKTVFYLWLK